MPWGQMLLQPDLAMMAPAFRGPAMGQGAPVAQPWFTGNGQTLDGPVQEGGHAASVSVASGDGGAGAAGAGAASGDQTKEKETWNDPNAKRTDGRRVALLR